MPPPEPVAPPTTAAASKSPLGDEEPVPEVEEQKDPTPAAAAPDPEMIRLVMEGMMKSGYQIIGPYGIRFFCGVHTD